MKKVAFVCILVLLFSCKKDLTFRTEAFYIEKDSTTAYLGQKTVKVISTDTSNGTYCSSSFARFERLSGLGYYKVSFSKNGIILTSVIVNSNPNGAFGDAKVDLCNILPCSTKECPTASDLIPLMSVVYDTSYRNTFTITRIYTENDSTSAFFGQETLKLTVKDTTTSFRSVIGTYTGSCKGNLLEIENLTNKTVKIVIYNKLVPTLIEWKNIEIPPRQVTNERLDLTTGGFSCSSIGCCIDPSLVIPKMKVTYN